MNNIILKYIRVDYPCVFTFEFAHMFQGSHILKCKLSWPPEEMPLGVEKDWGWYSRGV